MRNLRFVELVLMFGWGCFPRLHAEPPLVEGEGWQVLFDGHDTQHWTAGIGQPFPASAWQVDQGCLHSTGSGWQSLYSRQPYRDFELAFVWRIPQGGNSGVKYLAVPGRVNDDFWKALRQPLSSVVAMGLAGAVLFFLCWWQIGLAKRVWWRRAGYVAAGLLALAPPAFFVSAWNSYREFSKYPLGFEYQMIDDEGYVYQGGKLRPNQLTGGLYDLIAPRNAHPKPPGEFNESRIVVRGTQVEHWLNGERVVAYELGSPALRDAVAASKFASIDGFAEKNSGYLELQAHKSQVWFREIRIRQLKP